MDVYLFRASPERCCSSGPARGRAWLLLPDLRRDVVRTAGIDPAGFAQDSLRGPSAGWSGACTSGAVMVRRSSCAARTACLRRSSTCGLARPHPTGKASNCATTSRFRCTCRRLRARLPALTAPADVSYRIDRPHDPAEDVWIAFDDAELAIPWPLPVAAMSSRDHVAPPLATAIKLLD